MGGTTPSAGYDIGLSGSNSSGSATGAVQFAPVTIDYGTKSKMWTTLAIIGGAILAAVLFFKK